MQNTAYTAAERQNGVNNIDSLKLAKKVCEILADKHGKDIAVFDLTQQVAVTDYTVVVSGSSKPQLKAMFDEVQRVLKNDGVLCYRRSGVVAGGWLLLDYIDVIIHIFDQEHREYYAIEELWAAAPRVD